MVDHYRLLAHFIYDITAYFLHCCSSLAFLKFFQQIVGKQTGGLILRLGCALHLTAGGGYIKRDVTLTVSTPSGNVTTALDNYSYSGGAAEVGLLMNLGNFSINAGTMLTLSSKDLYMIGNFGLGVCF